MISERAMDFVWDILYSYRKGNLWQWVVIKQLMTMLKLPHYRRNFVIKRRGNVMKQPQWASSVLSRGTGVSDHKGYKGVLKINVIEI